MDILLTT